MTQRIRHDVAFAAASLLVEPLRDLMGEEELGKWRAYCYETLMGALEKYDGQIARERKRLSPMAHPPANN
jgi:hypothetical protein